MDKIEGYRPRVMQRRRQIRFNRTSWAYDIRLPKNGKHADRISSAIRRGSECPPCLFLHKPHTKKIHADNLIY